MDFGSQSFGFVESREFLGYRLGGPPHPVIVTRRDTSI